MLARMAVGTLIRDLPHGVATDVTLLTSEVVSDHRVGGNRPAGGPRQTDSRRGHRRRNGVQSIRSRSPSLERFWIGSLPRRPPSVSVGCRPEGRLHDLLVRSRLGDEPPAAVILVPVGRASLPCCCGAVSHNWPHAVRRHAERRKTQPHPAPMMWEVSDRISNLTLTRPRTAQPGGWHRG